MTQHNKGQGLGGVPRELQVHPGLVLERADLIGNRLLSPLTYNHTLRHEQHDSEIHTKVEYALELFSIARKSSLRLSGTEDTKLSSIEKGPCLIMYCKVSQLDTPFGPDAVSQELDSSACP